MPVVRSLSIVQLILFAFIAVALPLVWAIFTALYQVDQLVQRNTDAIVKVKQETLASRALADNLTSMERSASQFQVLADSALHEVYLSNSEQFRNLLNSFKQSELGQVRMDLIDRLVADEQRLSESLRAASTQSAGADTEALIAALHAAVRSLITETDALLVGQTDSLSLEATTLKQQLLAQASLALPVTVVLSILFVVLITRPIRQLDTAVRELGESGLKVGVEVSGPHDLKALGVRLNWLRQKLLEVEQQKQAFLRNISHELKTPLTSIREAAELLVDSSEGVSGEQREIVRVLKSSSLQLQHLIENLLRFNELTAESGDIQPLDLQALVDNVTDTHRLALNAKGLTIESDIESVAMAANPTQIRLVIDNLLSNAIKFSPPGGAIRLEIKKVDKDVKIIIQDYGPGVAAADAPRIFDLFYRGAERASGPVRGSGLGLAIVKEIVARLRGRIELVDVEQGARFSVTLPVSVGGNLSYAS
ncbi:HAMP domain-containing histidine kinase [Exilibacterium tricleocarpae]|uniref:histidine kinase n=1 Tax=Exilibacterium tricleocarpae TaxID=2591008 RepID=A0A545SP03_9GAMM|nr:HAMP domain-containing sensor histidine kinase [Exilibacterium tricleocarpae]TQV66713.1 HAMP domain-containing histidine kinase [Exilibacterium tricleocarpae]